MQTGESATLEDRKIVELLIQQGPMTAPKICKYFGVKNHQNAVYRLDKLAEKNIIKISKKKYGTTYSVHEKIIATPTSLTLQVLFTLSFLVLGTATWVFGFVEAAAGYLLCCSLIGTLMIFLSAIKYKKEKVKNLLERLD